MDDNFVNTPLKVALLAEGLEGDFETSSGTFFDDISLSLCTGSSPGMSLLN